MELKYGLRVRKFCHTLHESPYSCSNSGVQELTLPFLNQKLSVSPLKPTPEPISGGKSHWPVIATITELCGQDSNLKLLAHQCVPVTPPHIIKYYFLQAMYAVLLSLLEDYNIHPF